MERVFLAAGSSAAALECCLPMPAWDFPAASPLASAKRSSVENASDRPISTMRRSPLAASSMSANLMLRLRLAIAPWCAFTAQPISTISMGRRAPVCRLIQVQAGALAANADGSSLKHSATLTALSFGLFWSQSARVPFRQSASVIISNFLTMTGDQHE